MPLPTSYHLCAYITFARGLNQDEVNSLLGGGFTGVYVGSNGCRRDHYNEEATIRALLDIGFSSELFHVYVHSVPNDNSWM